MRKFPPIAITHPELASEAFGWDPSLVSKGSDKKRKWKCIKGHIYEASPNDRTRTTSSMQPSRRRTGTGCPYCSNKAVLKGFNDLTTTHPNLARECFGWDPDQYVAGSGAKVEWKCQYGHKWIATINSRTGQGTGCPYCTNVKPLPGVSDLKTIYPKLAEEAYGWDPSTIHPGTKAKKYWKCRAGHIWLTSVNLRTLRGFGCPYCSNQKLLVGFNDLLTTHPRLSAEASGWDPSGLTSGSLKKVKWRCSEGHIYISRVRDRAQRMTSCTYCAGKKVMVGFNDLGTLNPQLANQAVGWDPSTVTIHSNEKRKWKCDLDHIWETSVSNRTQGKGCPSCSKTGFNPNEDGYLYFLVHEHWSLFQIGISNAPKDRVAQHSRAGWQLLDLRGPMEGYLAQKWEIAILQYVKSKGGRMADEIGFAQFDGYTEAWLQNSFEFSSLKEVMDSIDESEVKLG